MRISSHNFTKRSIQYSTLRGSMLALGAEDAMELGNTHSGKNGKHVTLFSIAPVSQHPPCHSACSSFCLVR